MRSTKLIFLEGLPHSGKSSTAQWLKRGLAQNVVPCRLFLEGASTHPIHSWRGPDMENPEKFVHKSMENWTRFAERAQVLSEITIFDALLLIGFARVLMGFRQPPEEIGRLVERVLKITEGLQPVMIYFHHTDPVAHIIGLCRKRGMKWGLANMARAVLLTPYAMAQKMEGTRGMMAFWSRLQDLTNGLYGNLSIPRISIGNPSDDWRKTHTRISEFMEICISENLSFSRKQLEKFVGRYHDRQSGRGLTVKLEGHQQLTLLGFGGPRRLIPLDHQLFCVEGTFFHIKFLGSEKATPHGLEIYREKAKDALPRVLHRL